MEEVRAQQEGGAVVVQAEGNAGVHERRRGRRALSRAHATAGPCHSQSSFGGACRWREGETGDTGVGCWAGGGPAGGVACPAARGAACCPTRATRLLQPMHDGCRLVVGLVGVVVVGVEGPAAMEHREQGGRAAAPPACAQHPARDGLCCARTWAPRAWAPGPRLSSGPAWPRCRSRSCSSAKQQEARGRRWVQRRMAGREHPPAPPPPPLCRRPAHLVMGPSLILR